MKRLLIILYLIPVLSFSQSISDGLVGYWPFNGNVNDESGNGNDGVVNGAILAEDRFGNANSAYSFDGVDDFIDIQDTDDLSFGNGNSDFPFSSSVWIKPIFNSNHQVVFSKWDQQNNKTEYTIILRDDNTIWVLLEDNSTQNKRLGIKSSVQVSENSWQNIAVTYDGSGNISGLHLYINGLNDPSISIYDDVEYLSMENTTQNFWIGKQIAYDGTNFLFNGVLDDVAFWDRSLTPTEIQNNYVGGIVSSPFCSNIFCDGENVGIGTSETHDHKLAVAGSILAEEIKVKTQENWPDYVFEENYPLADLKELEAYIIKNKHLPQIPNAKSIKEEGYNLSELDAKLLEKIEELTLYIIEQEKEIESQKERIEALERQNKLLELIELRLKKLEQN